jgi:hypothetical protein
MAVLEVPLVQPENRNRAWALLAQASKAPLRSEVDEATHQAAEGKAPNRGNVMR